MDNSRFGSIERSWASVVSIMLCGAASAQDAESRREQLEEVIVTGSLIEGTPEDTALPVEVITMEELDNLGRPSNLDLVKTMSEMGQVAGEWDRYNAYPVGAATVNLRSIGARFTTVIFNGRRFPEQFASGVGRFNNVSWIPNAAIGRIEILKEGGAATYGADAIGGVVNYITRRNLKGLEVNADYRYIEDSDGDYTADVIWGETFERGNILTVAGYQHRSVLRALDRDWALRHHLENRSLSNWSGSGSPGTYVFQTAQTNLGTPGFTSINPNNPAAGADANPAVPGIQPSTGLNRYVGNRQMSATGGVRDPNCTALGGFAGWSTTPSPVCYLQVGQFENLVDRSDSYQLYTEFNYRLTDSVEFHSEGLYYQLDAPEIVNHPSDSPAAWPLVGAARQQIGTTPVYFVDGNNPAVADFLNTFRNSDGTLAFTQEQRDAIINGGRAALPFGAWRPFGFGGSPVTGAHDIQHNNTKMYRLTGDLTGDLPQFWGTDLEWNVALTYSRVDYKVEAQDMLVDRLQDALNGLGGANCNDIEAGQPGSTCQWFNPFSSAIPRNIYTGEINPGFVPSLQNDPELVRWLYTPIWLKRTYDNIFFDAVVRGESGFNLRGGPVAVALGGQFRWVAEEFELDDLSNRELTPCATPGVTNCAENIRGGPMVFNRSGVGVLGTTRESRRRYPVVAAFGEVQLPLLDTVNLQLAGRYEKFYSDVTDKDNQVFVPAGAIKWQALPWLALRTSAGKTFSQVNPPKDDGPTVANSIASNTFGQIGNEATQYTTANYDNVGVDPERGSYLNVGFIMQLGNLSATVDYFDIRVDDYTRTMTSTNVLQALVAPGQTPAASNLINCSSPLFEAQSGLGGRPFVELNGPCVQGTSMLNSPAGGGGLPGGRINYFGGPGQTNSGELKTTGIDVTASYGFDEVFGGRLRPSIDLSYLLEWQLGAFVVAGVPVSPGYDGLGFVNSSTGRIGQTVPEWRGSVGLNYQRGRHTVNLLARYIPSVINEDRSDFDASADQNANIGDANGVVTTGTGTGTTCTMPGSNLTSDLDNVPTGAGSGEYGAGSIGAALPGAIGFCGNQNVSILSGRKIASSTNLDLTYRIELPAQSSVSLTIYNLLDEDPSFARQTVGYNAGFGSPLERNYKMSFRKRF